MRRKSTLICLLLLLLALSVCACEFTGVEGYAEAVETEPPRFNVERASDNSPYADQRVYIITDTATGVQYLFFYDYRAGGLTVLEPAPEKEAPKE